MEDYTEIATILSKITNIELDPLIEELGICEGEIAAINNEVNERITLSHLIADKVKTESEILERRKEERERLEIELIQAKTKLKKLEKNVGKLKSLNSTTITVSASENDLQRINEDKAVLHLARELTKTEFNNSNEVVITNAVSMSVDSFNLSSRSKTKNREQIWEKIEKSSKHAIEFEKLFFHDL